MSSITITSDIRDQFGEARDQGARPTCLTFATSDAHASIIEMPWNPLSCEYLFFHAKQIDGSSPRCGTTIRSITAAIPAKGQPDESQWPYLKSLPEDLGVWIPPTISGQVYRASVASLKEPGVHDIWTLLEKRVPTIIAMTLSDAFYVVTKDGLIDSDEPVDSSRKHALVVVAIGKQDEDRFFLVRNSWGIKWGVSGYAWLSERYLTPRLIAAFTLQTQATSKTYV